ncbi:hypothetical protein TK5_25810 [Sideroxyarcus sp. TK5]
MGRIRGGLFLPLRRHHLVRLSLRLQLQSRLQGVWVDLPKGLELALRLPPV